MIDNKLHYDGKDSLGRRIIIDAADLGYGKRPWEIMAMRPGRKEIAVAKTDTKEDAERIYTDYVCRFTASYPIDPLICEPLTGKYAKLRDDLASAFAETLIVEETEDGGTCNVDSAVVKLPGWDRAKVKQAVQEANGTAFLWTQGRITFGWCISPRGGSGQANRRTRRAEAISEAMELRGYETSMYYQMD